MTHPDHVIPFEAISGPRQMRISDPALVDTSDPNPEPFNHFTGSILQWVEAWLRWNSAGTKRAAS